MKNIKTMLTNLCDRYADNNAFVIKESGKHSYITYRELLSDVMRLSNGLLSRGLNECTIVVSGKNSYEWAISALAVFVSGNVLCPIDGGLPQNEFDRLIERSNAKALIYSGEIEDKALMQKTSDKINMSQLHAIMSDTEISVDKNPDELGVLMFTSGTTSASKAVMLSQTNFIFNVDAMLIWEHFYESDINLALLPYYHAFGLTSLLLFLNLGMCSAFCEGLRIKRALLEYHISVFVAVPLVVERMRETVLSAIKKSGKAKKFNFALSLSRFLLKLKIDLRPRLFKEIRDNLGGGLRLIVSGAAPLSEETYKFFNDIGVVLIQGYGLTEAAPVIASESDTVMRMGSVGKPLPGVEVEIDGADENGIGEICAKGKNIMLGYRDYDNSALAGGYFHTGDMGRVDKDGFLFITGRKKNVIVLANGKNVFPEELEGLIQKISGVKESLVYILKDVRPYLAATIVYDSEVTTSEAVKSAVDALNEKIADYKKIRRVIYTTEEFPKTSTGKIKRTM